MKNNKSVCAIIVTYNIGKDFYKCFNSIYNQVGKIIIIDNGSDSETIEVLEILKNKKNVEIILNTQNLGIAKAINQGLERIKQNDKKFNWVITLDNDSECTENMIENMLNTYYSINEKERSGILGIFPKYIEKGYKENYFLNNNDNNYQYVETEITSGNLINMEKINQIGFMKEELFIDYVDHEFCMRCFEYGLKMIKVNDAILLHSLGQSKKIQFLGAKVTYTNHSELRRYYITRNRFWLWNEYRRLNCDFIKYDKISFIKENIKILLFENNKLKKFKSSYKGYKDYKKNIYGEIKRNN